MIAETIAGAFGVRAMGAAPDEVPQYSGFLAEFADLDNLVSDDTTRQALVWEPTHSGWVEDDQTGHYTR